MAQASELVSPIAILVSMRYFFCVNYRSPTSEVLGANCYLLIILDLSSKSVLGFDGGAELISEINLCCFRPLILTNAGCLTWSEVDNKIRVEQSFKIKSENIKLKS